MIFKVEAVTRTLGKKSDINALRRNGLIPAVIYGPGVEAKAITLNKAEFMKSYKKSFGEMAFFEIECEGQNFHTLIKERQIHPVSREILHVDFMVIPPHQMIEVDVPLKFVGTPEGVKAGGMMEVLHRTLKIVCMEDQIPEDIEVDISRLNTGESLHVGQIPAGNWKVKDHAENALVSIHAKRVEAAAPAEEKQEEKA